MARHPLGTGKAAKKRREQLYLRLGVGGAVLFVCIIGVLLSLRHEAILIKDIHVEGYKVLEENDVRNIVQEELVGSYGFIIPKASAFFYPRNGIENALRTTHKRIKEVVVERSSLTSLTIRLQEREPAALWCRDDESVCYFMDASGYVFADSPTYSGNVYVLFKKGMLQGEIVGSQYMPEDEFSLISFFIGELSRLSLSTRSFEATADEYVLHLAEGGRIMFVRGANLNTVLLALETTLMSESFKKHTLAELEYLDLRFANKAVVKWRESAVEAVVTPLSSQDAQNL
jgi:hypothetical protein